MAIELPKLHGDYDEKKYQGLRERHAVSKVVPHLDTQIYDNPTKKTELALESSRIKDGLQYDALLEDLRRKELKDRRVNISDENLQKILAIYVEEGDLNLETIDSIVTIESVKDAIQAITPEHEMFRTSKPGGAITKMDLPHREEFLRQFPVKELFVAFSAADEKLNQMRIKKTIGDL